MKTPVIRQQTARAKHSLAATEVQIAQQLDGDPTQSSQHRCRPIQHEGAGEENGVDHEEFELYRFRHDNRAIASHSRHEIASADTQ